MEVDEYAGRVKLLGFFASLVIIVLLSRVFYLQIIDGEKYASLAEGNRIRIIKEIKLLRYRTRLLIC